VENVAGIIVAGGQGTRIGGGKPLLSFGTGNLLDAVIARALPQVAVLAVNIPADHDLVYRQQYGDRFTLLPDPIAESVGPLNGVLAGLEWIRRTGTARWLASFPCDTPFLPLDLVSQLTAASDTRAPVAAKDWQRVHALCALWPVECADILRSGIEDGSLRSIVSALEAFGGKTCLIRSGPDAFFNINMQADLMRAEEISARRNIP
jgi:molybdopterin-guanine dinucleotide biosynthesis protein A